MAWGKNKNTLEDEESKISRINSAGLINITIENSWRESYKAMIKGDLVSWNRILDTLWVILGGDCKEKDIVDKEISDIDKDIYSTGSLNHKKSGFETSSDKENENIAHQYILLKKKALFLRRLQNIQGKGTSYQNDDYDDFD